MGTDTKPVAWIDEFGNAFPLDAWKPAKRAGYLDYHKKAWKPLFTHPAPQPQPERQPVSEPTEAQIEYEILCNGEWVAGASGEGAEAEILHYLTQYEEDGPCEVYAVTRRLVDRAALAARDEQ